MQPRNRDVRKGSSPGREPGKLLSVRLALILGGALLAGLGSAGLLYAAHRPAALVAFTAAGVFGVALKFFDWLIELLRCSTCSMCSKMGSWITRMLRPALSPSGSRSTWPRTTIEP